MSRGFKHIARPDEARWESIQDNPVVFYKWARSPIDGRWVEKFWAFNLWAEVIGSEVEQFEVRLKWGTVSGDEQSKHVCFPVLDAATAWVDEQVGYMMNDGFSTVRQDAPPDTEKFGHRLVNPDVARVNG